MMKSQNSYWLRAISLLVLLVLLVPVHSADALPLATTLPPVDMFQLPWDQGLAWDVDRLGVRFRRAESNEAEPIVQEERRMSA